MQIRSGVKSKISMMFWVVLSALLAGCGGDNGQAANDGSMTYESTANPELIAWHTSEAIAGDTPIAFGFVGDVVDTNVVGSFADSSAYSFNPNLSGKLVWKDRRTLEFKADGSVPRGVKFTLHVSPSKLKLYETKNLEDFLFSFSIRPRLFHFESLGFVSENEKKPMEVTYLGAISLSDSATQNEIKESLTVALGGKDLKVEWNFEAPLRPTFKVAAIVRTEKAQSLVVNCKAPFFEANEAGPRSFEVAARQNFLVSSVQVVEKPSKFLRVEFTHPLMASQDLRGLVTVEPASELRFAIKGSILEVYFPEGIEGTRVIVVDKAIKNSAGESLKERYREEVNLKPVAPEVRFIGTGVIIPRHNGVSIPIETVNLNAIIVSIERIYSDRVTQFLQVNELSGTNELRRVGKKIWKKIVPVPYSPDRQNRWVRTALDLSPLISDGDHSLYRISLSFDVRHVEYPGARPNEAQLLKFDLEDLPVVGGSSGSTQLTSGFWDSYRSRKVEQVDWDDWNANRTNPFHPAYYSSSYYYYDEDGNYGRNAKVQARNFLVSDIGVIAQKDANNVVSVAVTKLQDAKPISGADVSLLSYQLQELQHGKTNGDGLANFTLGDTDPFLVSVESGGQIGYLKLSGSSAMPVSHYDIAGQEIQQGIKGYLFGERGVWRPGNDIFLTFILWDRNKVLPDNHPVVLSFYDPKGKLVKTTRETQSVGNFYHFKLSTEEGAVTGTYTATVQVGGLSFSKEIPIETIKPNRLKIDLSFPKGLTELTTSETKAKLKVNWLHGTPARGSRVDMAVRFNTVPTVFANWKAYVFDDPSRSFKSEEKSIFNDSLDDNGEISVPFNLESSAITPGKLVASIKTRAYEPSGDFSTDVFTMPFSPYKSYAGISIPDLDSSYGYLDSDKPHAVQVVLVDSTGKGLNGTVNVEVFKVEWHWWWDRFSGYEAEYLGQDSYKTILSEKVTTKAGIGQWQLKLPEHDWGRYFVRVTNSDGHVTGSYFYAWWSSWHYPSDNSSASSVEALSLNSDKKVYVVGDTAKISIPSSAAGRALVSVENSGRILSTFWIDTQSKQTLFTLPITAGMAPNVYLHVTLIQPHGQTENDLPIRLFGILPVMVEDPQTRLEPILSTADSYEPNTTVNVTVSEKTGRPMTYSLALVDEGLLSLTRYKTPSAWDWFFRRDSSVLQSFDIYGMVAGAYSGVIEKLLAIGGSDEGKDGAGQKANRFPPMVRYLGPFTLPKDGKVNHSIEIPQYIGAVRVMLVAGNDEAFGTADKTVTVKKPLMVQASLPRISSVSESFVVPVTVFALDDGVGSVTVTIKGSDLLKVVGPSSKKIKFTNAGEQLVNFDVQAANSIGQATVEVTATSSKVESSQKVELEVRVPTNEVSEATGTTLAPGKSWEVNQPLTGVQGTNRLVLEASRFQPLDLGRRLDYLIHYPYGCVEQTTSSVFPQLFLDKVVDLSPDKVAEARANIQAGINRLYGFQTSSGGLSYWQGESDPNLYGTSYAAHFLFEAEREGYVINTSFKNNLVKYLRTLVQSSNFADQRANFTLAYALFDLALAGNPELGAMNRLREADTMDAITKFKLAGAYSMIGRKDDALALMGGAIPSIAPYNSLNDSYGSDLRDYAILAEGLILGGDSSGALGLIQRISKAIVSSDWYSTQTLAYSLVAVATFIKTENTSGAIQFTYQSGGKTLNVDSKKAFSQTELPLDSKAQKTQFTVTNTSNGSLFVRLISTGRPAVGNEKASAKGLTLSVRYENSDGNTVAPDKIEQGSDLKAKLTVSNTTNFDLENLALDYIVPSGWEITNSRFEGWQEASKDLDFQDFRDDRIFSFFSLKSQKELEFTFPVHATYTGKFYLPSPQVSAMYDAAIQARGEGKWVTVLAPKTVE